MGGCECRDRRTHEDFLHEFWGKNNLKNLTHQDYCLVLGISSLKPVNIETVKSSLLHIFCQEYYHNDFRDECTELWNIAFRKYNDCFLEFLTSLIFLCEINLETAMFYFKEIILFKTFLDKSKSQKWYNRNLLCSKITKNLKDTNPSETTFFIGHYSDTLEIFFDLILNLPKQLIVDLRISRTYQKDCIKSFIKKMLLTEELNYSTDDTESEKRFKEATELSIGDFFNKNYNILTDIKALITSLDEFANIYEENKIIRRSN